MYNEEHLASDPRRIRDIKQQTRTSPMEALLLLLLLLLLVLVLSLLSLSLLSLLVLLLLLLLLLLVVVVVVVVVFITIKKDAPDVRGGQRAGRDGRELFWGLRSVVVSWRRTYFIRFLGPPC